MLSVGREKTLALRRHSSIHCPLNEACWTGGHLSLLYIDNYDSYNLAERISDYRSWRNILSLDGLNRNVIQSVVSPCFFVPRRRRAYYYYLICLPSPVVSFIRRHIFLSVPFPVKCITCPLVLSAHVRADDVAIVSYSAPDKWIISLLTF